MTKHTSGDWRKIIRPNGRRMIEGAEEALICQLWQGVGNDEMNANAALITAAPDMLALLKKTSELLKNHYFPGGESWQNDDIIEMDEEIQTAISKAQPK